MKYFKWKDLGLDFFILKNIVFWLYNLGLILGFYIGFYVAHNIGLENTVLYWVDKYGLTHSEPLLAILICFIFLCCIMALHLLVIVYSGFLYFLLSALYRFIDQKKYKKSYKRRH